MCMGILSTCMCVYCCMCMPIARRGYRIFMSGIADDCEGLYVLVKAVSVTHVTKYL